MSLIIDTSRGPVVADTRNRPSPALWTMDVEEAIMKGQGFGILEEWLEYTDTAPWTLTQATAGTGAITDAEGGVLTLDSNSTTTGQGVQIQHDHEMFLCSAGVTIIFEAHLKITDLPEDVEFFIGLSETDTSIIASGANTSTNHIGWELINQTDKIPDFVSEKATVRETMTLLDAVTDATYIKLGFRCEGLSRVIPYFNGRRSYTATGVGQISTSIPIVEMTPSVVCQTAGTSDPIVDCDWIRVVQWGRTTN